MRFLVQGEGVDTGPVLPPDAIMSAQEHVILPSLRMFAEWEKSGKLVGGNLVGQRAGVGIIEVESLEELNAMLTSLPFWGIIHWTVTPIMSFGDAAKAQEQILAGMRASVGPPR